MTFRPWPRRLALLLVGLGWLALAHPQAQSAPVIQWTHPGTNVTHFQIVIGTTGTWVVDAGLPTPSGTTYEYALPALPAGTWQIKVRACYGADCQDSATMSVVKMVPAGATALNYYWVSPTGAAASWAACKSDTPLSGAAACGRATASTNAVAGDTVWFRGGTYSVALYGQAIVPAASGSSGSPITFAAHPNETPVLESPSVETPDTYGAYISGKNYIVIRGFTIHNMPIGISASGGSYNELSYNTIYRDGTHTGDFIAHPILVSNGVSGSTHNWIHHNTIHTCGEAVYEGCDGIKVGENSTDTIHHNTVEQNLTYHQGHTTLDDYGTYEVIVNNVAHNEGWKASTAVYGTATGGSNVALIDTATNFVTAGVKAGHRVITSGSIASNFDKHGRVTSISTTTNTNDTVNYEAWNAIGAPTFAAGTKYAIIINAEQGYAPDPPGYLPGDGKYGHRTFSLTYTGAAYMYKLFEGNRGGHAGANSQNNGPEALTLQAPGNIIRYNDLFGADGAGIYFKSYNTPAQAASYNRVYANTIYGNGRVQSGHNVADTHCAALSINDSTTTIGNVLKNNILFQNGTSSCLHPGDVYAGATIKGVQTWANNLCQATDASAGCTATAAPGFVSTTMTDPMSLVLPNFKLQAGADAIDIGTNAGRLTQANGASDGDETPSVTLVVDDTDARYFQDGTWGSDLSRNKTVFPDWIAVGTVSNVAQISSINYATNTITLASPLTWADNASVWLYKKSDGVLTLVGAAPDYGAHEYGIGTAVAPTGVAVR
jgi:hypothetical protein